MFDSGKFRRFSLLMLIPLGQLVFTGLSCVQPAMSPPVAKRIPHAQTIHGLTRIDDYDWLRHRSDPEVITYLQLENQYTQQVMKHTEKLQEHLYEELKGRIKETDLTVPTKVDDYYYYTRTFEGKQYRVHCRTHGLKGAEEILLDENELAKGHDYFRLGVFETSPDHKLLAYATDTSGSETYTLRFKNLESGELLSDEISGTYYSLAWAGDNRTVYYTVLDRAKRPFKVLGHVLGSDPRADAVVHHESDEMYHVRVGKTLSRRYVLITSSSQITSEVRFLESDRPEGEFRVIHPRQHGMEYSVAHRGDHFYIVTNDEATNFRLMRAPVADPAKANWTEVIGHRPAVRIERVTVFENHLVIHERQDGVKQMRVRDLGDGSEHYVEFPEPVYTYWPGPNEEFGTKVIRYTYMSLVTPRSVIDYDMDSRDRELKKQQEVLGGYDPSRYQSERVFATADDGTKVPISMVYKKGMVRDGKNPMLLYGYGSYGASMDPYFSSDRLSLIDRGFVYAIGHVRGGSDLGRPWYENGKLLSKRNTFTDFIACAEYLVAEKYTSPDRLATQGASAGGLLMGAVANMRPDLFRVVVAEVPFVDVINTMLDRTIPLTVIEFEEWGDPRDKTFYDYMMTYSPYDNVEAKAYPNMLVTAGLNDPRVQYWEPAKWTAKLRALKTDDNRLLLKTHMGAGHGGASGRYGRLKEEAFVFAFIMDVLGIEG